MLIVLVGVSLTTDIAEIEIQAQMFSTLPLQITSFIVVSTVVPLAEEVIFRGALFNAVMRPSATGLRGLAVPVIVSSIAFAVLHVPSGFVMLGPILQITLLAFYLGVLRAATDSVIPSVVAHMTWNLVSAAGYALANTVQVP
jgi:membrane protease YdiL (CAAX protease family)